MNENNDQLETITEGNLSSKITKDFLILNKSIITLKDLPREAAKMLIDHFSSENAQNDMRILASDLKSFKQPIKK